MPPVLVAIPLLAILVASVLIGEMNPSQRGPCHGLILQLLVMLIMYSATGILIEGSRELNEKQRRRS
jgi:hypothetical protein